MRTWGSVCGEEVHLFDIGNPQGLHARVSDFGGLLQALWLPDAQGNMLDVVLGYDTPAEYAASETFFGAFVGPLADRLEGGRCVLNEQQVCLPLNAGPDNMHSGPGGFHAHIWKWEDLPDGIAFYKEFSGENAVLPGRLNARIEYRISGSCLRIVYSAESDCETAVSFTNHSYFSLNGGKHDCLDHRIRVNASKYAETMREVDPICTGRKLDVHGTPLDLRESKLLGDVLRREDFREIRTAGGLDHYFITDGEGMREHARVECAQSGIYLICNSDAPGILVYAANGLETERGKQGAVYGKNWAICLETERFPNAVNMPAHRESVLLRPGEKYRSATEFVFEYRV